MTGQEALDWNNASGTAMFDVAANSWSKEVLDWLGLTSEKTPEDHPTRRPDRKKPRVP